MKLDKEKVILNVVILLGFAAMGVVIGMLLQQAIFQATLIKVASNMDGVQIDININETKMVEGITDFYTPYFEEMINKSSDDALNTNREVGEKNEEK